jgi:hypothetical protein
MDVMNASRRTTKSILAFTGVASFILIAATLVVTFTEPKETNAQIATTASNQTATTTASQTGAAGALVNMTNGDFEPVRENLALARESIHGNDPVLAYRALGWTDNEIFILANEQENQTDALLAELKPLQDRIQNAQTAIQQGNNATALNEIGSAETALLQVTQRLAEEPEEPVDEDTADIEGGG